MNSRFLLSETGQRGGVVDGEGPHIKVEGKINQVEMDG